ncbi:hypothetical protein L6452_37204 [Arctium lappa]|uniref:Uncharacterized protein n=1 Tax=Arctium lappa TaxID=4217 RepID=A0ACB8Y2V1_ARCLA|nr:hypothetical protein L6452_37204 [Arctium lappa]
MGEVAVKSDARNLITDHVRMQSTGNEGRPLISYVLVYNAHSLLSSTYYDTPIFSLYSLSLSLYLLFEYLATSPPSKHTNKWRISSPMTRSLSSRKPSAYLIRMGTVASPQRSLEP